MNTNKQIYGLTLLLLLLTVVPVMAGGLYLGEFATPSTGTASAGSQAWGHDASTSFHNPAAMTRIQGSEFMAGAMLLSSSAEFDQSSTTPVSGDNGGDAGGLVPAMAAYFVHSFSDNLKYGFASNAVSGAALDYKDTWTGRRQAQDVALAAVYFNNSIAYRINDSLSISAGVALAYGTLEMELNGLTESSRINLDGDDAAVTFNLSTLIEFSKNTRLGIVYWYETDLSFSGDLTRTGDVLDTQYASDTELTLPQTLRAGIYHQLNDKVALLGSIGWDNWATLDNVNVSVVNSTVPLAKNWDDTWYYSVGLHYRVSEPWLLQCGIAYDTSPVSSGDRTADMPVDRQVRYATGVLYDWSEKLSVGGQFEYVDLGNAEINKNNAFNGLIGDYETNNMFVSSVTFNWKW